jgi:hypothetical protein
MIRSQVRFTLHFKGGSRRTTLMSDFDIKLSQILEVKSIRLLIKITPPKSFQYGSKVPLKSTKVFNLHELLLSTRLVLVHTLYYSANTIFKNIHKSFNSRRTLVGAQSLNF